MDSLGNSERSQILAVRDLPHQPVFTKRKHVHKHHRTSSEEPPPLWWAVEIGEAAVQIMHHPNAKLTGLLGRENVLMWV